MEKGSNQMKAWRKKLRELPERSENETARQARQQRKGKRMKKKKMTARKVVAAAIAEAIAEAIAKAAVAGVAVEVKTWEKKMHRRKRRRENKRLWKAWCTHETTCSKKKSPNSILYSNFKKCMLNDITAQAFLNNVPIRSIDFKRLEEKAGERLKLKCGLEYFVLNGPSRELCGSSGTSPFRH